MALRQLWQPAFGRTHSVANGTPFLEKKNGEFTSRSLAKISSPLRRQFSAPLQRTVEMARLVHAARVDIPPSRSTTRTAMCAEMPRACNYARIHRGLCVDPARAEPVRKDVSFAPSMDRYWRDAVIRALLTTYLRGSPPTLGSCPARSSLWGKGRVDQPLADLRILEHDQILVDRRQQTFGGLIS